MADKKADKKKEDKKLSKEVEKIVENISKLSVMDLSDLVNALQDKLGVSAMPMAAAPATTPAGEDVEAEGETGGGNLVMTASGDNKITVIKALREVNQNWGLKEAKDMTEQLPTDIIKDGKAEEVKEAAEKLKAAGATVEVK